MRTTSIALLVLLGLTATAHSQEHRDTVKSLAEQLRRLPPVEAEDAGATFEVADGYELQLVASEPLLRDPVDACFDADGRMYLAEMRGYPYSAEVRKQQPEPLGRPDAGAIRLLEDTTGDGKFDRSVIFADKISWPTSVCPWDGGVFVVAPPHLYYFKDTDGDDVADVRRIVWTGFSRANVQALANNLKWGLDGAIYGAGGRAGADLVHDDGRTLDLGRRDFRFDPVTESLEPLTGGVQFGHCFDDWGNRFVCSNSNHIQHVVFPQQLLDSAGAAVSLSPIRSIAAEGPAAPVYRRSPAEPWRIVRTARRAADPKYRDRLPATELVAIGFFTSATGVTVYRGDAYRTDKQPMAFIGDVGGNLIHRKTLEPAGVSFIARRATPEREFVSSTDTWFRPVNFVNAPDGCLFVLDMYRETIEHPASIPEDIKEHLDLESGTDRGRIYRIAPSGWTRPAVPKLADASDEQLVAALAEDNAWHRLTAQRLLRERHRAGSLSESVPASLQKLLKHDAALARLHAAYVLSGWDELAAAEIGSLLSDPDEHVREHAVLIASTQQNAAAHAADFIGLVADGSPRVRFALAIAATRLPRDAAVKLLTELVSQGGLTGDERTAVLAAAAPVVSELTAGLLNSETVRSVGPQGMSRELLRMAGATAPLDTLAVQLDGALESATSQTARLAIMAPVGQGLRQRGQTAAALLKAHESETFRDRIHDLFEQAEAIAADSSKRDADRTLAVGVLALGPPESLDRVASETLTPQTPLPLQLAVLNAIDSRTDAAGTEAVLEHWPEFSGAIRTAAVSAMTRTVDRSAMLLDAIAADRVRPAEIPLDVQQTLRTHRDRRVQERSEELFGTVQQDRAQLISQYEGSLENGTPEEGKPLFEKHCAACHRIGTIGHPVGPDLASVKNKSPRDLLISILDPNRESQPNYLSYAAVTDDGRTYTGIIVQESAGSITLRQSEGKEETIARDRLELLKSNGISLMPVGLEKQLPPDELADVIAYVRELAAP